ncbi:1-acyl-sn-glycerol-3-phosphate acyltransferase [Vibrio brasiliensis]|uniref:1-acyl-sn-glycerol-3-phosphate acyltransferase n=1 Tax=Vibrio brasiliensis LMG 20546 TaxID=945543 RepID=E8LTD6_9VIBR|nr:lysophospholipid acyltransferase family protein [Vibrio brasiliensis]EGA66029.1 1-acyl-sn-glycerol-3-phosphate acyltransferase [Vibrio brasiliensis LMG 20546]MCG9647661.1 1-acyl-sn-glycerol-3-phosphate acyltransferase [Vibrio brasiliensis]MCG9726457.1 1-acyl-sn-glycerol-3-phosphate acyltransferase [Vibrio brasiliensis]MCG9751806.1 1-acyl-sn-glycerol-3-phosphate acyltransferase [Vibrio brasiliensis]MCG9781708.1 1-acyl-sn-glycerol-3-phosphate acyltransferase [Vibrio brasiliensis]
MTKLGQYWRVFATGFCFSVFGLGGLTLSFIVIPAIRILISDKTEREYKVQNTIQQSFNFFCKLMKFTGAIDYQIVGADILKNDRNCLIVANHPSLIDYVLIASQLERCDCLVKSAIWANPFMKHIVKAAGYIPNETPDDLLAICEQRFEQGNVLLVFPEGTRTTPGVESKLQRGSAQIAVRTGRDLRLIHITVSPSFLTKEKKWYQVPPTKPFFLVEVKDKVEVKPFIEQTTSPTLAARRLQQHLSETLFPENPSHK